MLGKHEQGRGVPRQPVRYLNTRGARRPGGPPLPARLCPLAETASGPSPQRGEGRTRSRSNPSRLRIEKERRRSTGAQSPPGTRKSGSREKTAKPRENIAVSKAGAAIDEENQAPAPCIVGITVMRHHDGRLLPTGTRLARVLERPRQPRVGLSDCEVQP